MRKAAVPLFLLVLSQVVLAGINVIPLPDKIIQSNGFFEFTSKTIIASDANLEPLVKQMDEFLSPAFGFHLKQDKSASNNTVMLKLNDTLKNLGDEGYHLKIDPNVILIEACQPAGIFFGIQTLRQLLPTEVFSEKNVKNIKWQVPCVQIEDSPRFKWRGLHLDVARHFMPVEFVKKQIDLMAMYKLNRFHWHLTDDQGWRVEIEKYPLLIKVGAYRDKTRINGLDESVGKYDNSRYGGYYTREQIREVVKYAKDRFIEVVPEIEMPGHCSAAISAYPWLSCTEKQISIPGEGGVFTDVYCAGKESVFEFNQNVLNEIMELFPSKYIHIGGDEVSKDSWKKCENCQARIVSEKLKDEKELQCYFIKRIEKFLIANNRKLIGWDEILEGGLAPEATMMCWRDEKYAVEAVKQGHDVIMSPTSNCYFDYYQANPAREPFAGTARHFLPIEKVYKYNPVSDSIASEKRKHVLGVQANVWTEWMRTPQQIEYMTWPRVCALAEVGWTENNKKDFKSFQERLKKHQAILEQAGVNFFKEKDIAKPKDAIRFMTYNIDYGGEAGRTCEWYYKKKRMGYFVSNGERIDNIIDVIKRVNPDVVCLQECTGWADNDSRILKDVAMRLGMYGAVTPNRNKFKVALLSRFPMSNIHWLDDDNAFAHNIIYADITTGSGQAIMVASQHFGWWGDPKWKTYDANGQKESYIKQYNILLQEFASHKDKPFIIAGDFNHSYADNQFDQKSLYSGITGLGYTDCCFSVYKDYSRVLSGRQKEEIKVGPIDFVFVSPSLSKNIVDADIVYSVTAFEASDHLPVWADIVIKNRQEN
jgi:hexosaminidase